MLRELRYGWRGLARDPVFSLTAVAVIGIGIGLTTAIYSVVRDTIVRPLPFPQAHRIAWVMGALPERGWNIASASIPELTDLGQRSDSFEEIGTYRDGVSVALTGEGLARTLNITFADSAYFRVLGAQPLRGRLLSQAEDVDPGAHPVVVVSERLWASELGRSPDVVGSRLELAGQPFTVVGVMPGDFWDLGTSADPVDAWLPLTMGQPYLGRGMFQTRTHRQYGGVARLAHGVSWERARGQTASVSRALEDEFPDSHRGRELRLHEIRTPFYGAVEAPVRVLFAGAALVLLVCCVNIAALQLVRVMARQADVSIRLALGASRTRIVRQSLVESLWIAALGGLAGVATAPAAVRAIVGAFQLPLPVFAMVSIDRNVLLVSTLLVFLTSVLFGLVPALRASRADARLVLDGSGRSGLAQPAGSRVWRSIVAAEIAAAVVLLIGAGLASQSLSRLVASDLGFATDAVLTMNINLRDGQLLPEDEEQRATAVAALNERLARFAEEFEPRATAIPNVEAAAVFGPNVPGNANWHIAITPEGQDPNVPENRVLAQRLVVTPGAFDVLDLRIVRGRRLDASDRDGAPLVAVVDQSLAAAYWPDQDAVGKRLIVGRDETRRMLTIVGIARDAKHRGRRAAANVVAGDVYLPYFQQPLGSTSIVVRASALPRGVLEPVKTALRELAPHVAITGVATMQERLRRVESMPRFAALLMGIYAVVVALLALVGTYGTLAYVVSSRSRELAVRMAIGATRADLVTLVLRQGMAAAFAGAVLGLAVAAFASSFMQSLLFGVERLDPMIYGGVAALALLAAAGACLLPACRAASLDPMKVIRQS